MSLKSGAFLLGLFTFLFYQNIFCMFADDFYADGENDAARIASCFEYMSNPALISKNPVLARIVSAPTPMEIERDSDFVNNYEEMEIERGSDFVAYKKDACSVPMSDINQSAMVNPQADDVLIEHDKDGDVVMKEKTKQNNSVLLLQHRQKKLLHWMALYASKKTGAVQKDRLINWLSGKWGLVKKFGLRDWFLTQLLRQSENREELLAVWSVFVLR
jgi:hypothetical protein